MNKLLYNFTDWLTWQSYWMLQESYSLVPRLPCSGTRTLKLCRRTAWRAWYFLSREKRKR